MIETLFGSTAPMWTPLLSGGFAAPAPAVLAGTPMPGSFFGSSTLSGGGLPMGSPPLPPVGPVAQPYGFGGIAPSSSVFLNPIGGDAASGVTVAGLLTAVAIRRGQPQGPTSDPEIEDFVYDALELIPGAGEVEVRSEGGRATLTGSVQHKRVKRDIGEILWAIPNVIDVQNNVTITSRRRARAAGREGESVSTPASRKQG